MITVAKRVCRSSTLWACLVRWAFCFSAAAEHVFEALWSFEGLIRRLFFFESSMAFITQQCLKEYKDRQGVEGTKPDVQDY
jgi:hypothetical protein